MKKSVAFLVYTIFFFLSDLSAQNCQILPAHPQAGEEITIQYDPTDTNLEGREVFAIAYALELGESPTAYDITMVKSGNGYTASFQPSANAQVVFFKIEDKEGKKTDNNNDEGYYTKIYKEDQPVKHAYAVSSTIYIENADLLGVKLDGAKAAQVFEKEITNPSERLSKDYLNYYSLIVRVTDDEKGKTEIVQHLNSMLAKEDLSEEEMKKLSRVARRVKEQDLYKSITEKIKTKFPDGYDAIAAKYAGFRKLETFEEQLAMYKEAKSAYGTDEKFEMMLDNMERFIANAYGKKDDFENMYKYAEQLSGVKSQAGLYNKFAWECTGGSLEAEGHRLEEGREMSMKSLKLIAQDMETLGEKLSAYSEREWRQGLQNYYGSYSDTYALLAYKNGDLENALKYQKIACESNQMEDADMNARYAVFIEKRQGEEEAMGFLENMISKGNANADMKQHFARLFKANIAIDQAAKMYLAKLEEEASAYKVKMIKEEMVNKKSPDFALKNLKGEEVSLESLKGKVVVVDFWATWCGPCKASFPGMQKAVDQYKQSDDVEFVFIDTWESSKKKEENAQKFIDDKGYTFNVLMDNDNKMVADFGVSGIPAKFILDKEGNIRFKSSGYNGSDEALIEEISMVVEILRSDKESKSKDAGAQP